VGARADPRLHAREGHRGRRHRLLRLVQPLPVRRAERRNVLELRDAALADRLAAYIDGLRER
jgi:hypothetical protein